MLKLPLMFQDHMVIQRDKKINIWGTAPANQNVVVTMQDQAFSVLADDSGKWQMQAGPFRTSFHESMEISCADEKIVINDVQVGEVWLAGGQSNMEFCMRYDADLESEKKEKPDDSLRFFDYPEVSYVGQIEEADYGKHYGFWRKADPEDLDRFSAVGYYFAKDLRKKYQIPVGIIGCNWGGTPACAWMPKDAIIEGGGQIYLQEYDAAVKDLDLQAYDERFKNNPGSWKTDQFSDMIGDMLLKGCTMEEFGRKIAELGADLSKLDPADFTPQMGPKNEQRPCGLYGSMLKQVAPYSVKGVIWYQGESDGDFHPELYQGLFPALIRSWRELWKEQLPFLFVQVAPLEQWMQSTGTSFIPIRSAQQYTADTVPDTGMAVITDVGMQFDIHPKKKQPVGHRLALLAENKVYHDDVLCEAPVLSNVQVQEGKVIFTFENAGQGLYLAEKLPYGQTVEKGHFGGLQIFQDGCELDDKKLRASAKNNQVIISGEEIHADADTEVKIAQTGWYLVNLYNSADIPAAPACRKADK